MLIEARRGILKEIEKLQPQLLRLSHDIHDHPELGNQELYAVDRITNLLAEKGWRVKKGIGGLSTAFVAKKGYNAGPKIAYLAEYDALPGIGHGCGHNLITAASVGAAEALSQILNEIKGQVQIIGTPAEETTGGKITLLEKGYFKELDAVLMFHPGVSTAINFSSVALDAVEVIFYGKGGHTAVIEDSDGDTLDAILRLFNWVKNWSKKRVENGQIQGIIKEGGESPNIRPTRTVARFYIRALREDELDEIVEQLCKQVYKTAKQTGTKSEIIRFEARYQAFSANTALSESFAQNLKSLGIECSNSLFRCMGSMDIGNISRVVPAIHPFITLPGSPAMMHTREFAQAAGDKWGDKLLVVAAQALALTGLDIFASEELRNRMWLEQKRWQ